MLEIENNDDILEQIEQRNKNYASKEFDIMSPGIRESEYRPRYEAERVE